MITMSNQCANVFNNRSFTLPHLKPHCNILCLISRFRNSRVLIGRKSTSGKCVRLPVAAHLSSSDIVLIATTVNRDGSLVFSFGDASEVVKKDEVLENDEVVEEIESRVEGESNVVNVLDGDQVRQVTVKTVERAYRTSEERLAEVAVGISNADIVSNASESSINVITDLSDYQEESSDGFLNNIEEEVLLSPSDAENDYLEGVESTDKTEYTIQADEDESSDPIRSILDNSQNVDEGADPEGTLLQDSEDEHADPSESVKLTAAANEEEELQVKNITEAALVDEIQPPDPLDVELTDAAIEVVEEELQDTSIIEAAVIDEMPPSNVELADAANEVVEKELQDTNITEFALIDEMIPSDPLDVELKDPANEAAEEEVQHMKIDEGTLIDEMLPSDPFEVELTVGTNEDVEEELQDMNNTEGSLIDEILPSDPLDVFITDAANDDVEELQDMSINESSLMNEMPPSDPLDAELTVAANEDVEEELQVVANTEGILTDELPPSVQLDVELADAANEDVEEELQVINTSEGTLKDELTPSDTFDFELTDDAIEDVEEKLQDMNNNEATLKNERDTKDLLSPATMHISGVELIGSANEDIEEGSQDMNVSEGTFIDEMPLSDPLGAGSTLDELSKLQYSSIQLEATKEVMNTEGMDVKDQDIEEEFQQLTIDNSVENDVANVMTSEPIQEEEVDQKQSIPVEVAPTLQFSDMEVQDATDQNLEDENLQIIEEVVSYSYIVDGEQSHQIEAQTVQDEVVIQNIVEESAATDGLGGSILLTESVDDPVLEEERTEDNVSSDELFESSEDTDLLLAAEAVIEREDIYLAGGFLLSGAALLEHPDKALTGGDDACFVAGSRWLGVANGVRQWSFEGTNPGAYAKELMRTCEGIVLDTNNVPVTNPVELLCRGVKETSMSGSSNVLIANFDGQALHVANIGDTGFLILRHGAIYKKSSPLLHEFHFALQVEDSDDPLQLVEEHTIELEEGDIVVSATDGLFDNLYKREIAMIVSKSLQAGMKPEEIANILATRAQEVGRSTSVRSPFSDAAQTAGYTSYAGGKPDNVAVIVSLVERISNSLAE